MTPQFADWLFGTSDLKRGVLGHLVNGYDTRYLKQNLRGTPMARRTVRSDRKSWLLRASKADIKQQTSPAEPVENDPGCVEVVNGLTGVKAGGSSLRYL